MHLLIPLACQDAVVGSDSLLLLSPPAPIVARLGCVETDLCQTGGQARTQDAMALSDRRTLLGARTAALVLFIRATVCRTLAGIPSALRCGAFVIGPGRAACGSRCARRRRAGRSRDRDLRRVRGACGMERSRTMSLHSARHAASDCVGGLFADFAQRVSGETRAPFVFEPNEARAKTCKVMQGLRKMSLRRPR